MTLYTGLLDTTGIDEYVEVPLHAASDNCEEPIAAYPPAPVEDYRILMDRERVRRLYRSIPGKESIWYLAPIEDLAIRLGIIRR